MTMTAKKNDESEIECIGINTEKTESKEEHAEPLTKLVAELAVTHGYITTSLIQRNWGIGYMRSAKIIDKLEQLGIVGCENGSFPRKTLITKEDFLKMSENGLFDI